MLWPVNILLKLMFLWLACLAFPIEYFTTNFANLDLGPLLNFIEDVAYLILRVLFFLTLLYTTYRFILFLQCK